MRDASLPNTGGKAVGVCWAAVSRQWVRALRAKMGMSYKQATRATPAMPCTRAAASCEAAMLLASTCESFAAVALARASSLVLGNAVLGNARGSTTRPRPCEPKAW